jgi:hypothetical protein
MSFVGSGWRKDKNISISSPRTLGLRSFPILFDANLYNLWFLFVFDFFSFFVLINNTKVI